MTGEESTLELVPDIVPENPVAPDERLAHLRHDLRTPINQIIGYSEMLQEDAEAGGQDPLVADLRKIQQAARQLLGLVNTKLNPAALAGVVLSSTESAERLDSSVNRFLASSYDANSKPVIFSGRVLAVDDNEENREVLSRRLKRHGLEVETAVNGREALEMVRSKDFDLVLLDIIMPELDGHSVLQQMKADPATRHIPVIMISALDQLDSVISCIEAGAEDFLPKPFNPTLLRARLGACLEKKALRDLEQQHLRTIQETQRRLSDELAEAANYVRSIFPPPSESPLRIDWQYMPSTELGGDAFGYHWIDEEHFAIYLLDVCGHGVGASLLSVTAINVIRSASLGQTDFRDPGAVLTALNNVFQMERQNNMYFTLWYGVYHAPTRTLMHASGGHPPALLLSTSPDGATAVERLRSPGLIIGGMEGIEYHSQSCLVPPGARLLVLCDGCYEIQLDDGRMMEFDEFERFMVANGTKPEGLENLLGWVKQQHGDGPLDDDFSIVRIQF